MNKPKLRSDSAYVNFVNVLDSAYENYYDKGLSNDLAAILSYKLNESEDMNESLNYVEDIIESANHVRSNRVSLNEALNVTDPHIVQEKRGKGISVTINGKEYRYVSPTIPTEKLFKSFMGMYNHAIGGYRALNYLKKNSLCYYGAKNPQGQELVGLSNTSKNEEFSVIPVGGLSGDIPLLKATRGRPRQLTIKLTNDNMSDIMKFFGNTRYSDLYIDDDSCYCIGSYSAACSCPRVQDGPNVFTVFNNGHEYVRYGNNTDEFKSMIYNKELNTPEFDYKRLGYVRADLNPVKYDAIITQGYSPVRVISIDEN